MSFTPWWKAMKRVRTSSCCGARQVEFDRRVRPFEGLVVFGGAMQEALVARGQEREAQARLLGDGGGIGAGARRDGAQQFGRGGVAHAPGGLARRAGGGLERGLRGGARGLDLGGAVRGAQRLGMQRRVAGGCGGGGQQRGAVRDARLLADLGLERLPGHVDGAHHTAQHEHGDQPRGCELEPDRQIEEGAHGTPAEYDRGHPACIGLKPR